MDSLAPALQEMSKDDQLTLRANIIEQVLATDMKRHFNILSRFQVSSSAVPLH